MWSEIPLKECRSNNATHTPYTIDIDQASRTGGHSSLNPHASSWPVTILLFVDGTTTRDDDGDDDDDERTAAAATGVTVAVVAAGGDDRAIMLLLLVVVVARRRSSGA